MGAFTRRQTTIPRRSSEKTQQRDSVRPGPNPAWFQFPRVAQHGTLKQFQQFKDTRFQNKKIQDKNTTGEIGYDFLSLKGFVLSRTIFE